MCIYISFFVGPISFLIFSPSSSFYKDNSASETKTVTFVSSISMAASIMKKLFLLFAFSLFNLFATFAQLPQKIEDDHLFGKHCYYLKQLPKTTTTKGILVLIPGYGEHPYAVSVQTTLLQEAEKNGIAVMMVNLTPNNQSLPIDENAMLKLGKMIQHFFQQEKISSAVPLYIGGFSIGGTAALQFYTQNHEFNIRKVFAIDPPLDMLRLRKSLAKGKEHGIVAKFNSINTDKQSAENGLKKLSVYHPDFLTASYPEYKHSALRIYCEPDILWWIKNRNMDLSDMNITDCAGYINKLLQKNPDQKVELILTTNKGIRNGNQIHPHSWSIAQPVDLINWLAKD